MGKRGACEKTFSCLSQSSSSDPKLSLLIWLLPHFVVAYICSGTFYAIIFLKKKEEDDHCLAHQTSVSQVNGNHGARGEALSHSHDQAGPVPSLLGESPRSVPFSGVRTKLEGTWFAGTWRTQSGRAGCWAPLGAAEGRSRGAGQMVGAVVRGRGRDLMTCLGAQQNKGGACPWTQEA